MPDLKTHWNFPKVHTHVHAISDIQEKGAVRNYDTKPNEGMHKPLKEAYQRQTNFKDTAQQVSSQSIFVSIA